MSRRVVPGAKLYKKSQSLSGRSAPRATEPTIAIEATLCCCPSARMATRCRPWISPRRDCPELEGFFFVLFVLFVVDQSEELQHAHLGFLQLVRR